MVDEEEGQARAGAGCRERRERGIGTGTSGSRAVPGHRAAADRYEQDDRPQCHHSSGEKRLSHGAGPYHLDGGGATNHLASFVTTANDSD